MSTLSPHEENPGKPTHRSRPSLATNASALAESTITFGSIMSNDGFARLSQFPPVPQTFSPVDEELYIPSPMRSDFSPSTSPTGRRALPIPPQTFPPTAPLNVQGKPPAYHSHARPPSRDTPLDPQYHPSTVPTRGLPSLSSTPTTLTSYPSPHDWHDGSSSIANDPYGAAALPTSFITSLISSASDSDSGSGTFAPSAYPQKRKAYEGSVISNALTTVTTDSTITYPPPKMYPAPLPGSPRSYPPVPPLPSRSPEPLSMPPAAVPTEGRSTPDTMRTFDSEGASTVRHQGSTISQTLGGMRAMSTTPSLQSLNSATPLIQQAFAQSQVDPILEEEEYRPPSGRSTPGKSKNSRARRASTAQSTKSTKSYVSSLVARISHSSGDRKSLKQAAVSWFRGKPLPPVPPLPNVPFREIQRAEDALALPELADRAQILSAMLDKGQRPYDSDSLMNQHHDSRYKEHFSATGVNVRVGGAPSDLWNSSVGPNMSHSTRDRRGRSEDFRTPLPQPDSPTRPIRRSGWSKLTKKQRIWLIVALIALVVVFTVAVAVGVTVGKSHEEHICPDGLGGALCNLNTTCVCTQDSGTCKQLAQSIVSLVPVVNTAFSANFTPAFVSDAVWQVLGGSATNDCAHQVSLIDVAPALDPNTSQNRTQWAQAALLWNAVQSENLTVSQDMRGFVQSVDWHSLPTPDGRVDDTASEFALPISGYVFDFAAQTVTEPSATFVANGQPSADQMSRVNDVAHAALDRMYTHAVASSTQQQSALQQYWTAELQLDIQSLKTFMSAIAGSPIMLPFDSVTLPSSTSLVSLVNKSTPDPFPPPLACYPGLTDSQLQLVNSLEETVFGLPAAPEVTAFDASCFPGRPVYGVLDICQLRLPFADSRTGVAKQAAVLVRDVNSRTVVYSGEVVSALPGSSSSGSMSTDPRTYGTIKDMNHVILAYLRSLGHQTANTLVDFILNPTVPPTPASPLFDTLSTLPLLEVAVFGTIGAGDIRYVASSLSDSKGSLYFGTKPAEIVRNWTIDALQKEIVWTENATAPLVVHDNSNDNPSFNEIWTVAMKLLGSPDDTVANITQSFNATQLLQP